MKKILSVILVSSTILMGSAWADDHHGEKAKITTFKASENVYMIEGNGGNIGVFKGDNETIIIDSQFADLSADLKAEIAKISDKPIKFLLNTHFHYDHTDGNANFGKDGAYIVSHDSVREQLKNGSYIKAFDKKTPAAAKEALPFLTYDSKMHMHEGDEDIQLSHYKAHTEGDTVVFFKKSNVIHTGDIYFNGWYPFIDTSNGGSVQGMIDAMSEIISIADSNTKIIPGHGALSDKAKMEKDLAMLKDFYKTVTKAKKAGKTKEEILKMAEIQKYDAEYGQAFLNTEKFLEIVFGE